MATHSSVLAWRILGRGSLVGCPLWGHTESDTTEMTQQQQQLIWDQFLFFLFFVFPFCFGKTYWKGHREFQASLLFCFYFSLGEAPLRGLFLRSTLCILCICLFQEVLFFCFRKPFIFFSLRQSVSRAPLFQKTLFLFQPQTMFWEALGAKWGTLGPCEAQTEAVAIALNQKVMDKFLKVCVEVAPHSSTLAWKITCMEKPGRLQSMGLLRVGHG